MFNLAKTIPRPKNNGEILARGQEWTRFYLFFFALSDGTSAAAVAAAPPALRHEPVAAGFARLAAPLRLRLALARRQSGARRRRPRRLRTQRGGTLHGTSGVHFPLRRLHQRVPIGCFFLLKKESPRERAKCLIVPSYHMIRLFCYLKPNKTERKFANKFSHFFRRVHCKPITYP